METLKVKSGVLPAMIVFIIFMLLTGFISKAQTAEEKELITSHKTAISDFNKEIKALEKEVKKHKGDIFWASVDRPLNAAISSLKDSIKYHNEQIRFLTPAPVVKKVVKKVEVVKIDTATMIRNVKQQIRALEEKQYKALSSNPDAVNEELSYSIDSLNRVITDLTPSKKEVVKVAKVEKPAPTPSMAKQQTAEIGRTMKWGEHKKINTIKVQVANINAEKYVAQNTYSQAVADVRLAQIQKDPSGLLMERPNGVLSYNAIGRAAATRYMNSAPKAFVKIVPNDPSHKQLQLI